MRPFKVVCIDNNLSWSFPGEPNAKPLKGEIYTVTGICRKEYCVIKELADDECYLMDIFRPVDDTFGEWVEETLMKELQYEEALKQQA